jgi:mannose-1-phosphate guanylyltransferase
MLYTMDKLFAVILVGGKGKRLRPLSTATRPKAFLCLTRDGKTMFRKTVDRARGLVNENGIVVVANKAHERLVKKDIGPITKGHLITEPLSRNTAPAIALAASRLAAQYGDCIMAVIPSDQYINDRKKYIEAMRAGVDFVRSAKDVIVLLGIKPSLPSTHLGYVRIAVKSRSRGIYKVEKFTEKPDLKNARLYVKSSRYLWNAGAFIFKARTILKALAVFKPDILRVLDAADSELRNYKNMPDISIDYAVMEKSDNIYCVKGSYDWCDIGNFGALKTILKDEGLKFVVKGGKVVRVS